MASSVYQFKVRNIDGETVSLAQYQGKVLVIVNVASRWGKTDVNYRQLVELTEKYPELRVLAFPCNQFGGQEPGTDQEIKNFATTKYNAKVTKYESWLHHISHLNIDCFSLTYLLKSMSTEPTLIHCLLSSRRNKQGFYWMLSSGTSLSSSLARTGFLSADLDPWMTRYQL